MILYIICLQSACYLSGPEVRGVRPVLVTFENFKDRDEVLRKARMLKEFDFEKIAHFGEDKINTLLGNEGIIRNKQKIVAAVNNAQRFITIREKYGTFSQYIWNFVEGKPLQNSFKTLEEIPAKTPLSEKISKDLKQNGFQFVGPTVVYAHMQATGMVNDHLVNCHRYGELSH